MTALTYGNAAEWQITKIHLSSCTIPDDTQKAVKRIAKDGLSACKKPSFTNTSATRPYGTHGKTLRKTCKTLMRNALTAAGKTKAEHAHKQAARPSFVKFSKLIVKISNYNTIFYKIILTFANDK